MRLDLDLNNTGYEEGDGRKEKRFAGLVDGLGLIIYYNPDNCVYTELPTALAMPGYIPIYQSVPARPT